MTTLKARLPLHITHEGDLDHAPGDRTLAVSSATWRMAVALAEHSGWRGPRTHFTPVQAAALGRYISAGLAAAREAPAAARASRQTPLHQLLDYFETRPGELPRLVAFLGAGAAIDVVEG